MTPGPVVAGIDVGNATTEVVLVDAATRPLAADRAPTRGVKGSARAAEAAARLAARLARRHGLQIAVAVTTGQQPVRTTLGTVTVPAPDTAPLVLLAAGSRTPGRPGTGCGVPVPLDAAPAPGPDAVLVAPAGLPYDRCAELVARWLREPGAARVTAVALAADEGVLVARRVPDLPPGVPVVDGVDAVTALALPRLAVEVAPPGESVRHLADPLRLVSLFALPGTARAGARALAGALADSPNAVVGLDPARRPPPEAAHSSPQPSSPSAGGLDRWQVDLVAVGAAVEARTAAGRSRAVVSAELAAADPSPPGPPISDARPGAASPEEVIGAVLGVPVHRVGTEALAARAGALTTPGTQPDAVVIDLGGGTLDGIDAGGRTVVAAGGGDLVTAAVAAALDVSRGAAEWVKRGPAQRLEGPHVLLGEDGGRRFTERPAPGDAVGSLVVAGPAGWLPFARDLAPAEWRALRLRLKRAALGDNLERVVAALAGEVAGRDVVLVGGVAGDPEILRVLDRALAGATVGRADVAAALSPAPALGHRWAVAYGLTLLHPPPP